MANQAVAGRIYRHNRFYQDDGNWMTKYLVALALEPSGDVVFRLLTSRKNARPEEPPCYHGDPYPGFYLGILGGELNAKSWLDLRGIDDYEEKQFNDHIKAGIITTIGEVPRDTLLAVLECTAAADDTTRMQERALREQHAALHR